MSKKDQEGYIQQLVSEAGGEVAKNERQASYMPDPEPKTIGRQAVDGVASTLDGALSGTKTAYEQFTGQKAVDSTSKNTNAVNLAGGQNSGVNIQQGQVAQKIETNSNSEIAVATKNIETVQNTVRQGIEKGSTNAGHTAQAGLNTFEGIKKDNTAGVAGSVAGAGAGAAGLMAAADIYRSAKKGNSDKIPDSVQAEVANEIRKVLTPPTDPMTGKPTGEQAAVPNNFDHQELARKTSSEFAQLIKEIMKPAHLQQDIKDIVDAQVKVQREASLQQSHQEEDIAAINIAEDLGINVEDMGADGLNSKQEAAVILAEAKQFGIDQKGADAGSKLPNIEDIKQIKIEPVDLNMTNNGQELLALEARRQQELMDARTAEAAREQYHLEPKDLKNNGIGGMAA